MKKVSTNSPLLSRQPWRCIKRFQGERYFVWHHHPEYQLVVVLNGRGYLYTAEEVLLVASPMLFVFPPGIPHSFAMTDNKLEGYEIDLNPAWLAELAGMAIDSAKVFADRFTQIHLLKGAMIYRLIPSLEAIVSHPSRIDGLFFILEFLSEQRASKSLGEKLDFNAYDHRLARMVDYMHQNYQQPITLARIAEEGNVSIATLKRLMSRYYRLSVIEYLTRLRIGYACELLLTTDQPIAMIAQLSGLGNLSHFHRVFLKQRKVTPAKFRRQNRKLLNPGLTK